MDLKNRFLKTEIVDDLNQSRAVAILGARQVGKSTLLRQIAVSEGRSIYDLDDEDTLTAVRTDPAGFIADLELPAAIDEVQREPRLLVAIKRRVDRSDMRGQFLLTGSADLRTLPTVSDSLPGRVDYFTLQPFSQGELRGEREIFLQSVLEGEAPKSLTDSPGKRKYLDTVTRGGFPEAQLRTSAKGLQEFFSGYLSSVLEREIPVHLSFDSSYSLHQLLAQIAARAGSILNLSSVGEVLGRDSKTIKYHLQLLESLNLVRTVHAWSGSPSRRLIKRPKIYITDSGLYAYLLGIGSDKVLLQPDISGPLFETFAVNEIARQASYYPGALRFSFYRDQDGREVDLLLERSDGCIAAVEIKASASIGSNDFRSLKALKKRLGSKFLAGIVISTGASSTRIANKLYTLPLPGLWRSELDSSG